MGADYFAKLGAFGFDHIGIWDCDLFVAVIKPRPSQPEPRPSLSRLAHRHHLGASHLILVGTVIGIMVARWLEM
jgi:hypothetical protein